MIFAITAFIAVVFIAVLLVFNLTVEMVERRRRWGRLFEISDITDEIVGHGFWLAVLGVIGGIFAQIIWGG